MDSDEKVVGERFTALSSALAGMVVPPPAALIRARGDRRRARLIAGSVITATVVGILIGLTVVAGSARFAGPTGEGTDGAPPLAIPAQFRLSHDREAGWTRQTDPTAPSIFLPCAGSDPTLVGRTDAVTASGPGTPAGGGPAASLSEQLILFRDADASGAAVGALVTAKNTCGWSTEVADGVVGADADVFSTGREVSASASGPSEYQEAVVLRRGNALWIRVIRVPGGSMAVYSDGAIDVRGEMCSMLHLCLR